MLKLLLSCVILHYTVQVVIASQCGSVQSKPNRVTDIFLPRHLTPEHYKLQLVPFLTPADNNTVKGFVEITVKCVESGGNNVTLHAVDLNLDNDTVGVIEKDNERGVNVSGHSYDADRQFHILHLVEPLQQGKVYIIKIHFVAQLLDGDHRGFFKDHYTTGDGNIRTMAATQFEATEARRAFPCMDEPALKATFEISLGRTQNMSSISNMPIREQGVPMQGSSEYVWDHFEQSVPMSTYVVAMAVSDYHFKQSPPGGQNNNVTFRVWAKASAMDQTSYAADIGPKLLSFFERYFSVNYPLPKQDMITIPTFPAAMENWGLITYNERMLLHKPGVSSDSDKMLTAMVISHELAHQWFGNLVTPAWWTDIWLNEGFATYVQHLGVDAVHPEMLAWEQFVKTDVHRALKKDSCENTHPISVLVERPDEIDEIFDAISYSKGGAIIRMMDAFLTSDTLRRGLTNYLNEFKFKVATQDDLWHFMTQQAKEDGRQLPVTVKAIMDTWTLQKGYPVVTVKRNYSNNSAEVIQERFLSYLPEILENKPTNISGGQQWWVPITFTSQGKDFNSSSAHNNIWLVPNEGAKMVSGLPNETTAVVFNVQQTGFYRVNYDSQNWALLTEQLRADHESIPPINRAQLLDDAFNLARSGRLVYTVPLELMDYLAKGKERNYVVWLTVTNSFEYLLDMFRATEAEEDLKKYLRTIVTHVNRQLVYSKQFHDVLMESNVLEWTGKLGMEVKGRTAASADDFHKWMEQPGGTNEIDVNLRQTVYSNAIRQGGEKEWDFLWQQYQSSNVSTEKAAISAALASSQKEESIKKYLNKTIEQDSELSRFDALPVIAKMARNEFARDTVFDFVSENWNRIVKLYSGNELLPIVVEFVMEGRKTREEVDQLIRFQEENKGNLSNVELEVCQAIEEGENNVRWLERNYKTIATWIKIQNNNDVRL